MKQCNPLIPEGYKYIRGTWDKGFIIERFSDGCRFMWVPFGSLGGTYIKILYDSKR